MSQNNESGPSGKQPQTNSDLNSPSPSSFVTADGSSGSKSNTSWCKENNGSFTSSQQGKREDLSLSKNNISNYERYEYKREYSRAMEAMYKNSRKNEKRFLEEFKTDPENPPKAGESWADYTERVKKTEHDEKMKNLKRRVLRMNANQKACYTKLCKLLENVPDPDYIPPQKVDGGWISVRISHNELPGDENDLLLYSDDMIDLTTLFGKYKLWIFCYTLLLKK